MEKQIAKIARDVLGLDTLETRRSNRLDFYDLAVWKIREACSMGRLLGRHGRFPTPGRPGCPPQPCSRRDWRRYAGLLG